MSKKRKKRSKRDRRVRGDIPLLRISIGTLTKLGKKFDNYRKRYPDANAENFEHFIKRVGELEGFLNYIIEQEQERVRVGPKYTQVEVDNLARKAIEEDLTGLSQRKLAKDLGIGRRVLKNQVIPRIESMLDEEDME